jgi:hypothetical protein
MLLVLVLVLESTRTILFHYFSITRNLVQPVLPPFAIQHRSDHLLRVLARRYTIALGQYKYPCNCYPTVLYYFYSTTSSASCPRTDQTIRPRTCPRTDRTLRPINRSTDRTIRPRTCPRTAQTIRPRTCPRTDSILHPTDSTSTTFATIRHQPHFTSTIVPDNTSIVLVHHAVQ